MKQYRVLRNLWYPTDSGVLRQIRNGVNLPLAQRNLRRALAGEVVDDLPRESIPRLLADGAIEEVAREEVS